jgi:hypothetical protein
LIDWVCPRVLKGVPFPGGLQLRMDRGQERRWVLASGRRIRRAHTSNTPQMPTGIALTAAKLEGNQAAAKSIEAQIRTAVVAKAAAAAEKAAAMAAAKAAQKTETG